MNAAAAGAGEALASALRAAFATHRDVVLRAPPGAGKSTLVPLALLDEPWLTGRKILLLEPRRVAARAIARRMAWLRGEPVGGTIGHRMRLDTCVSRSTRIEVITEGVLARMLHSDPELAGVGCVIFDEFHERSLQADLGLALCLDARAALDADFRVLAMSATLDGARVAALLDDAPVIDVPGRQFEVAMHYVGRAAPLLPGSADSAERLVARTVRQALEGTSGDLLVFLPGAGEIRRVHSQLADMVTSQLRVLPLYGELSAEEQDAALAQSPAGVRRIVLATNIAETSVTIPGVTVVIDSGLARRSRFDPVTGMSRLEVMRISRAAADQRAGRAGRTAPGVCYRLWSEGSQAALAAFSPAEITETDLAPLALELAQWGSADAARLAWLDPPPPPMLAQARELLHRLEALDEAGAITPLGREMADLPLHPRLAHMLLAARVHGAVPMAAELAALLSERDLMRRVGASRDPDLRTRLEILHREPGAQSAERGALLRVQRNAAQFQRLTSARSEAGRRPASSDVISPGMLLALAFPDRIAQRRAAGSGRFLLANGRGAAFPSVTGLAAEEYLVAVELDDREREARIDLAAPLQLAELEELYGAQIMSSEQVEWDERSGAVQAVRTRRYGALLLETRALQLVPAALAAEAMLAGVRQLGVAALPWDDEVRNLQARLEFVRRLERAPGGPWPASDDAALLNTLELWLPDWIDGMRRREHLLRLPLAEALLARLSAPQRRWLDELAPREIVVPSGSRIRVDYASEGGPSIAVRLQEVFGLASTPLIGGGTTPVTFKLLSPARRPVQITRDLAGFWRSSYIEVRKEMRGRYPRHHWPENPLEAAPSRGARRR
ncbi:MAG TPA: ATP-dependent helicase HrpB [Steroidobacteraceae bacterium]|nr:ATP-dependent helicase HrpB [Steroidobacteraceae bacterium]